MLVSAFTFETDYFASSSDFNTFLRVTLSFDFMDLPQQSDFFTC